MPRTSGDITRAADELQAKLARLRKEARRMKKLEEQREAEERRQQEIADALEFVEFTKGIYYSDSDVTVYEYITTIMEETKTANFTWASPEDDTANDGF